MLSVGSCSLKMYIILFVWNLNIYKLEESGGPIWFSILTVETHATKSLTVKTLHDSYLDVWSNHILGGGVKGWFFLWSDKKHYVAQ